MQVRRCFLRLMVVVSFCLSAGAAHSGSISFRLTLKEQRLEVLNTGDSPAFFPSALALAGDGGWQTLKPAPGQEAPSQLVPGAGMEFLWSDTRPLPKLSGLEVMRPLMVRFFDQAGVGFGQISFFAPAPDAAITIAASYARGALQLSAPQDTAIGASWVLWPQQDGIQSIYKTFDATLAQPSARRIEWRGNATGASINTGAALPPAILVHETAQGYRLQRVAAGSPGGKQQRSPWLDASSLFYSVALACAVLALGAALWWRWRGPAQG